MPSDDEDPEVCKTCHNSWAWHQHFKPMHPFNDGQPGATAFLGRKRGESRDRGVKTPQRQPETAPWPLDPVLRVALINKGILTPDDLRAAEETIRMATAQFEATVGESRNGQSTEEARGREVQE